MGAPQKQMGVPSPPIDIKAPSRNNSASPRNQSNLTSALQQAAADGMDISYGADKDATRSANLRHESLGVPGSVGIPHTGARPINEGTNRRGSNTTGSFMGGMSFGGFSMNSWMQDDIMMGGTSPFNPQPMQSPSYHSSSYLPKMEADYWRNLECCNIRFNNLHELLQHFEEVHRDNGSTFPFYRMSTPGKGGFFRRKSSTPAMTMPNPDLLRAGNQQRDLNSSNHLNSNSTNSQNHTHTQDGWNRGGFHEMDTIGEMEMDFGGDSAPFSNQPNPAVDNSRMRPGPVNPQVANAQHLATPQNSHPSTPVTARVTPNNNPMVSQVNTPSFTTSATVSYTTSALNSPLSATANAMNNDNGLLTSLNTDLSNLEFNPPTFANVMNTDMLELTVTEPARTLYHDNGDINTARAQFFGFVNGASTNPDNHGGAMQPTQMGAQGDGTAMPTGNPPPVDPYGGEDRPFKCLVVGCEKAYKNANGLRYHERHGHSSQQLTKNPDGTLSIVNPETGEAFPGTVGMEKEKPYRCEQCGKRYKNLNGLKYHKNHSPPCNPDLDVSKVSLPGMGAPPQVAGGPGGGVGVDGAAGPVDGFGGAGFDGIGPQR